MGLSLFPGLVVQESPGLMHHSIVQVLLLVVPQGMSSSVIPKAVTGSRVRERKWLNRGTKSDPHPGSAHHCGAGLLCRTAVFNL